MGCYNTITCMASYIEQAQDPKLKQMLEHHFPKHVEDYNMKVQFLQSNSTPNINEFQPAELSSHLQNYTQVPVNPLPRVEVRTQNVTPHNDREIATGYLLNQKSSAKNYAMGAIESANPELRTFLENAFMNSSHHAYDVWQYMVEKGYYPLSPAPQQEIQNVASVFPILEPQNNQQQMHQQRELQFS